MPVLIAISLILYIVFVLFVALKSGSVTIDGREIKDPFLRGLIALAIWPLIGLVLWLIGLVGGFLLLPFAALFGLVH
ncbi:MAG: hypothetical protein JWN64_642 [Parcubacteria group bacterium]|nr:hypothetical protein [Parcubacteria group bacterium]